MKELFDKLAREKGDVTRRINKLDTFISTNSAFGTLTFRERCLMRKQLRHMVKYHKCVAERMEIIKLRMKEGK